MLVTNNNKMQYNQPNPRRQRSQLKHCEGFIVCLYFLPALHLEFHLNRIVNRDFKVCMYYLPTLSLEFHLNRIVSQNLRYYVNFKNLMISYGDIDVIKLLTNTLQPILTPPIRFRVFIPLTATAVLCLHTLFILRRRHVYRARYCGWV